MKTVLLVAMLLGCHADAIPPVAPATAPHVEAAADHATVPLSIVGNRPFIDLTFRRPDGSTRTARFLVDTGGGAFLISEPIAHDLGLAWGQIEHEEGESFGVVTTPVAVSIADFRLDLADVNVAVMIGKDNMLPAAAPGHADGLFPGALLSRYHVVFDYPKATFTIAKHGVLAPVGDALPMAVSKKSGFPRIELEIDGVTNGFLLDTGASFTMVSEALLKSWGTAHADWERHAGAFGEAATLGGQTLETMTVPAARWGQLALHDVGVTSQNEGVFEHWMSSMMSAPIVGSLAGNVLKHYRVELDYANERLYVSGP